MSSSLKEKVLHKRKKLERTTDNSVVLSIIQDLARVPMTVDLLQDTGIGKVMRTLSKKDGKIGAKASTLLTTWRSVVVLAQKGDQPSSKVKPHKNHDSPSHKEKHNSSSKTDKSLEKHSNRDSPSHKVKRHTEKDRSARSDRSLSDKHSLSHKAKPHSRKEDDSRNNNLKERFERITSLKVLKDEKMHGKPVQHEEENNESSNEIDSSDDVDLNSNSDQHSRVSSDEEISSKTNHRDLKKLNTKHSSHKTDDDFVLQLSQSDHVPFKNPKTPKSKPEDHLRRQIDEDDFMAQLSQADHVPIRNHKASRSKTENHSHHKADKAKSEKHSIHETTEFNNLKEVKHKKQEKHSSESKHKSHKSSKPEKSSSKSSSSSFHDSNDESPSKSKKHKNSEMPPNKATKHKNSDLSDRKSKKHKVETGEKSQLSPSEEQDGLFFPSETSFADCLTFTDGPPKKKKKVVEKKEKKKTSKDSFIPPAPPEEMLKLSPKEVSAPYSSLPQLVTNYKPLPHRYPFDDPFHSPKKAMTNEDAILFTSSKKEKTCVYSGKKNSYYSEIPKLQDACIRVMIDHIDEIGYMGLLPYFIVSPLFDKCTPSQLFSIENYNPHFMEDTQDLWQVHCKRDFRNKQPLESETWRDLYWRASEEREKKLKSLTASISQKKTYTQSSNRVVKLAYVDSFVKPPRDVARRQARNGTAGPVNHTAAVKAAPPVVKSPAAARPAIKPVVEPVFKPQKPKVAPLMAKTLKSMKQCFRR